MENTEILGIAQEVAGRLGIRIKDPALVLRNMKPKTGITTILDNEVFILWIDKHYVAYNERSKPEIVYVFADEEHVNEELRSVISRIKVEKSAYVLKTLNSVKSQLYIAEAAMRKSGSGVYFFKEVFYCLTDEKDESKGLFIMTLCEVCIIKFEYAGEYNLQRINLDQEYMELCTNCANGFGWDYKLSLKKMEN